MIKKRIYMIVEVQHRELDARIAFAIRASQLGYSVVFCKKAYLLSKSKYLINGVVILKSIGIKNKKFISTLKKDGHIVCSLDEEGLLFHDPEKYCKRRIPLECFEQVKYFFTWGKNDFEAIKSFYPLHIKKVFVTGNSRIELLKKPINEVYIKDAIEIKEKYGEFILVNTKFGYANYFNQTNDLSIVDALTKIWNLSYNEQDFYSKILQSQLKRRNDLLELINLFEKKYPKKKFIIRPHQSEKPYFWNNLKNKNIVVIRDAKSSLSWMIAAKDIISFNCTTAIEAKFFGIDHLNYIPLPDNDFELPNRINRNFDNIKALEEYLNIKNKKNRAFNLNELKKYIENIDNDFTSNIINIIKDEFQNLKNKNRDEYSNNLFFLYFKFKRFIINLFTVNFKKLTKNKNFLLLYQKNPKTSLSLIKKRSYEFMEVMNIDKNKIKIYEIYPDMYCYEKINI